MSQNSQNSEAEEEAKSMLVPKLRFPEFRGAEGWGERPLSEFMSESRLPGSKGNVAKKITVKLWGNGVFEKNDAIQGSINTQYFRRNAGQFIYSKLDFLNQAFGIIPPSLDGFESTVDLPCFDFADGLIPAFLLEYVKRRDFYERLGETADGSRKARRIHAETFLSFPIALPSPTEQQKIAECLSSVDELIAAQARKVDALKTHKKGLMQQLFPREGETHPRLRFPEFQNAGEWEKAPLSKFILSLDAGVSVNSGDSRAADRGEFGVLKTSAITKGQFDPGENKVVLAESELSRLREPVTGGTIIMCRKNTPALVGANAYVESTHENLFLPDLLWAAKPREGVSMRFLAFILGSDKGRAALSKLAKGSSASMSNITKPEVLAFSVTAPSPAEQHRIASCLSSLDALITAEAEKHEALKTHKKGLMQQLFPSLEEVDP
jgi:type I restriction enzyme S subunit